MSIRRAWRGGRGGRGRGVAAALVVALVGIGASGCASRNPTVRLENQSDATLDVVAALPGKRRPFKTLPRHEGYIARLEPNELWESTPDTIRSATAPNAERAVRLTVTDVTDRAARAAMEPIVVEPRGGAVRVRFFGRRGQRLRYEVLDRHDAPVLAGDLEPEDRR